MAMEYWARNAYKDKRVAQKYDAERFNSLKGRIEDLLEKKALKKGLALLPPQGNILEVPVGTGRITEYILQKGFNLTGIDISQEMLSLAQNRLSHFKESYSLMAGDAEKLSFQEKTFDGVISVRLFGHLPPEKKRIVLNEFAKVSRSYVIVSIPLANTLRGYYRRFYKKLPMWFPVTVQEMNHVAEQTGLKVIEIIPIFGFISETAFVIMKKQVQ
jgi:ubiquinone/menaquinone biosynthesis C-methylase UbiE